MQGKVHELQILIPLEAVRKLLGKHERQAEGLVVLHIMQLEDGLHGKHLLRLVFR